MNRRHFISSLAGGAAALSLPRSAWPQLGRARRLAIFYFPDGVPGASQDGEASAWHPPPGQLQLPEVLSPLLPWRERMVFFRGLSMGGIDAGSHPGGAKKLLTAVDRGEGQSIDQVLARTVGADAAHRLLYLGVQANQNGASADKHVSYPVAGRSQAPEDNPRRAFERVFGGAQPGPAASTRHARRRSILDIHRAELTALRSRVSGAERARLELHADAVRELERRLVDAPNLDEPACGGRAPVVFDDLHAPERFPETLSAQTDLLVNAFACGLTRVGVLQLSHHTSELVMSRFSGTEMYNPNNDMRSHQASHYGPRHDLSRAEYRAFVQQRRWYADRFAALLSALDARPEGDGTMLDHTLVLMCSEVSDGNTHLHDDMPFALAGGPIRGGRTIDVGYRRHGDLFATIGAALSAPFNRFGQESSGPIDGVL